ncbi:hypothetical protein ElyMa_002395600 [Elysia marginata]|uniref:Uncharacterized protein n=1 Tax=Elysia marginata TaxID=1093978 RepID=A0AAV4GDW9_9GAST|nr:hypothetical protein ElyMa_002395600 [Elysia marginata]
MISWEESMPVNPEQTIRQREGQAAGNKPLGSGFDLDSERNDLSPESESWTADWIFYTYENANMGDSDTLVSPACKTVDVGLTRPSRRSPGGGGLHALKTPSARKQSLDTLGLQVDAY